MNEVGLELLSRFLQGTPESILGHGVLVSCPLFLVSKCNTMSARELQEKRKGAYRRIKLVAGSRWKVILESVVFWPGMPRKWYSWLNEICNEGGFCTGGMVRKGLPI